jgi:phosphatidylserine/phosphatidylglycerophosphate/cardiolipin synthase-like enzyme
MTNRSILEALRRKAGVSIVIQKEDFLRPDAGQQYKRSLRELYNSLTSLDRSGFRLLGGMSTSTTDMILEAVRCVGVRSSAVSPKMHHKFVVFCEREKSRSVAEELYEGIIPVPYAVWTGSFNFTYTGTRSFENAIYIEDPEVSRAYFNEWEQIAALSEPLDWESPYVAPQWRIGS